MPRPDKEDIKIFVAVTFRDFTGTENEGIQRLFIESIMRQTYPNWRMVVTIFNEKHVQTAIQNYGIDAVFYVGNVDSGQKFSLTDVLLNAICASEMHRDAIIVWTTCDVIFKPNFFASIVSNAAKNLFATSHPHLTFRDLDHVGTSRHAPTSINTGFDLVIMSAEIFRDMEMLNVIRNYRFVDWGLFEHFLVAVSQMRKTKRLNLFPASSVSKIENDRKPGAETTAWFTMCWQRNKLVMDRFLEDHGLSREFYNLTYCHTRFKMTDRQNLYRLLYLRDYLNYAVLRLKIGLLALLPRK